MRKRMKRAQYYLDILVVHVVKTLDPEVVVIEGGIAARLREDFVAPIRKTAYKYSLHHRDAKRVKIVPGLLGDNAEASGAAVFARQRLGRTGRWPPDLPLAGRAPSSRHAFMVRERQMRIP